MKWWTEYVVKILVILISALYPFILISIEGEMISISQYWNTSLQPLFIVANVMTAYFFFSIDDWKIPSFLLVFLTAFSVQLYPTTHDIIATLFFISCLFPLTRSKRFKFYTYFYLVSILIGFMWGLLWLEIWGILILCIYHLHNIIYTMNLYYSKHKIEKGIDNN